MEGIYLDEFESINLTKEAREMGKIPPEAVADKIAACNYTLKADDPKLSPRAKEMVKITQIVRKNF